MFPGFTSVVVAGLVLAVATPQFVPEPNNPKEMSTPRHHLQNVLRKKINDQVSVELQASLQYMAMSSFFASEAKSRPGFAKFFKKCSKEEWDHAQKFVDYLAKRGGQLSELKITMPTLYTWKSGLSALKDSLSLEGSVTDRLSDIHKEATDKLDAHLTDFLESEYLTEQVESMNLLSGYVTNLKNMTHEGDNDAHRKHDALAEFLFDVELQRQLKDD